MEGDTRFLDFATLQPPSRPNAWLIAPPDAIAGSANEAAPVFAVPAERAARAWVDVVEAQPRTRILAVSPDGLQLEAEQHSAVFGFVDRVSARFIPLAAGRTTLALYSRAEVGYWDLGVNRRRLRSWLAELKTRLGSGDSGTIADPAG
jgi:uncharacterized protein (DUF1499 family)